METTTGQNRTTKQNTAKRARRGKGSYQNVLTPPKFVAQISRKFTRIVKLEPGDRYGSVYCFIDMENGDLRKAAGFKAPAPHKRGSIFNDNCDVGNGKPADMHGSGLYIR